MREIVATCLGVADYAIEQLAERGMSAWRNEHSITVVFPRPADEVIRKWQIAPYGDIGHLITMPHVTRDIVDEFISDYTRSPPSSNVRSSIVPPGARVGLSWRDETG
jgi:histidine decarboxylase